MTTNWAGEASLLWWRNSPRVTCTVTPKLDLQPRDTHECPAVALCSQVPETSAPSSPLQQDWGSWTRRRKLALLLTQIHYFSGNKHEVPNRKDCIRRPPFYYGHTYSTHRQFLVSGGIRRTLLLKCVANGVNWILLTSWWTSRFYSRLGTASAERNFASFAPALISCSSSRVIENHTVRNVRWCCVWSELFQSWLESEACWGWNGLCFEMGF